MDRHKTVRANFVPGASSPIVPPEYAVTVYEPAPLPNPEIVPASEETFDGSINPTGVIASELTLVSDDGKVSIVIPASTTALEADGTPLTSIIFEPSAMPPAPPPGQYVVSAYQLGPDGATFAPPITVTIAYDLQALPAGTSEDDLVLAFHHPTTGEWVELDGITVDTLSHTIRGTIDHITEIVVLAKPAPQPATPTSTPAAAPAADDDGNPTNFALIGGILVAGLAAVITVILFRFMGTKKKTAR